MYNYLVDHALITQYRSGFLWVFPLSPSLLNYITFFAVSQETFDRVWHRGLLFKLSETGVSSGLLNWISDYLHDRQQRVIISLQGVNIPQGSMLGPLLFLIYINGLSKIIQSSQIRMFPDDTCLFVTSKDHKQAQVTLKLRP